MTNTMLDFIASHNRRGFAVGRADIKTDSIDFVFKDEKWNFPSLRVVGLCRSNGTFYIASPKALRKLARENGSAIGASHG